MTDLWFKVDQFIDSCLESPPEILIAHGIHLLAVNRLRGVGESVPAILAEADRVNTLRHLAGRSLLQRMRSMLAGPMVLIKGPEVAAHYPKPVLRAYGDLDILVSNSAKAKSVLLAGGFEEVDDYEFSNAQRPLRWPGLPLVIELHHELPWLAWMTPPPTDSFLANAIPSITGLEGVDTLPKVEHALLVAAHAWRHAPLRRCNDLIDVAALAQGQDPALLAQRANEMDMGNVWSTMIRVAEGLLEGKLAAPVVTRLLARHLHPLRERSVAEVHAARWIGALWAPTPLGKMQSVATVFRGDLQPLPGEPWRDKWARTARAVRDADSPALLRERETVDAP